MMRYESENDVNLRLKSSLVRKGNEPVYVQAVEDKETVVVHNCHTGRKERIEVEKLNLTPVPLGYVITGGDVVYVTRKPTRKYKQGLTNDNSSAKHVLTGRPVAVRMNDEGLAKTIMGEFPSIEEAFQRCREGADIIPFSRNWAVANCKDELCVMYKCEVVGYVGDNSVMLSPDKYYLKESLMEALNV